VGETEAFIHFYRRVCEKPHARRAAVLLPLCNSIALRQIPPRDQSGNWAATIAPRAFACPCPALVARAREPSAGWTATLPAIASVSGCGYQNDGTVKDPKPKVKGDAYAADGISRRFLGQPLDLFGSRPQTLRTRCLPESPASICDRENAPNTRDSCMSFPVEREPPVDDVRPASPAGALSARI